MSLVFEDKTEKSEQLKRRLEIEQEGGHPRLHRAFRKQINRPFPGKKGPPNKD